MSETQNKLLKAAISLAAAGVVFFLPFASWGIQLSPIEIRVIAMFVMAALFWILEPIPIWKVVGKLKENVENRLNKKPSWTRKKGG